MAKRGAGRAEEPSRSSSSKKKRRSDRKDRPAGKPGAPRSLERLHIWQVQMVRDVLFVAAVIAVFWVGYALRAVTVPLLVALLLAYLFEPLISKLCRERGLSRPVAVGGLLAAVGLAAALLLVIAVPLVVGQTVQIVRDVRDGVMRERVAAFESYVPSSLRDEFGEIVDQLPAGATPPDAEAPVEGEGGGDAGAPAAPRGSPRVADGEIRALVEREVEARVAQLRGEIAAAPPPVTDWKGLSRRAKESVAAIFGVLGALVNAGLLLFLVPFYFFFFSLWYPEVVRFGRSLIPQKNRRRAIELLSRMDQVVAGFVRGRIVISVIMGVLLAIGWMICGVPYSIPLGLVVGVFCAVPYLGVIGIPLAVGLLFFERLAGDPTGLWWVWVILWPTVVFAIVQLIEGYALTPMIAGKATNLDPVTIIVAVLAGGSVLGVYGMLLAIPLAACGKILFTDVLLPRVRAWTRGEAADPLPIDRD